MPQQTYSLVCAQNLLCTIGDHFLKKLAPKYFILPWSYLKILNKTTQIIFENECVCYVNLQSLLIKGLFGQ